MEAFDRAIEGTITAINTGCLRARDGGDLTRSKGKTFLNNAEWRQRRDLIVDLLRAIRSRYDDARKTGAIYVRDNSGGDSFYDIRDPEVANWMDQTRSQVLSSSEKFVVMLDWPFQALPSAGLVIDNVRADFRWLQK